MDNEGNSVGCEVIASESYGGGIIYSDSRFGK